MKAPTGKLAFAYRTISELEAERDALLAERDRLAAENERLARDAKNDSIAYLAVIKRQEELRAEVDRLTGIVGNQVVRNPDQDVALVLDKMVSSGVYEYRAGDELDEAIDAAMAAKEGK